MENIIQSSQLAGMLLCRDDAIENGRSLKNVQDDESMDICENVTKQSVTMGNKDFSSYLNLSYSNFSDDSVIENRRSMSVRKRLFCDTSPNTSVQSNCRKKIKVQKSSSEEDLNENSKTFIDSVKVCENSAISSSEYSSCDEDSSNNSLLFKLQLSNKRRNVSIDSSTDEDCASDEYSSSTSSPRLSDKHNSSKKLLFELKLKQNLIRSSSNEDISQLSSVDYSIKDYDYTIFRDELSLKIAEQSFAVSTENESEESEEQSEAQLMDISLDSKKNSEVISQKISENLISKTCIEEIVNDVENENESEESDQQSEAQLMDISLDSKIFSEVISEEISENLIKTFIEEIVNDIVLSIILGVNEYENISQTGNSFDNNPILPNQSDENIEGTSKEIFENSIEKIIDKIIDELIELSLKEINKNHLEEMIEANISISENTHETNNCYSVPQADSVDLVKEIIEEIFGEDTHDIVSSLQDNIYDVTEETDTHMDYSVGVEAHNDIVDQMSISHNSDNQSGDASLAKDLVASESNTELDYETLEPLYIPEENAGSQIAFIEDQSEIDELQSNSELVKVNETDDEVLDFMMRNFSVLKNSETETREIKEEELPKKVSFEDCKSILTESTKENNEINMNIPAALNLYTLSHERVTADKVVTVSAQLPLLLPPRPNFDDLPIVSSFISVRHKKGLRAIMSNKELSAETKLAQKNERKRLMLIKSKQDMMEEMNTDGSSLVLDYDSKKKEYITVHPQIVPLLKKHQVDGVKFMYDCCFVGINSIETFPGSGCILAHCMGLGKTLQLITLIHTIVQYDKLKTKRILVLCPKSTVMNWVDEIVRWTGSIVSKTPLKSYVFPDDSNINNKIAVLNNWYNSGTPESNHAGILLCGYEAFRALVFRKYNDKKAGKDSYIKKTIDKTLLKPGADLVVCDEGHIIKNDDSSTSRAITQVATKRRIVLTGTPIQNNLNEYFCMVDFIKPSFLGSKREFKNIYANPIQKGEAKDSMPMEIRKMKEQSYILNRKMSPFVHRREQTVLDDYLPNKIEYVVSVPITDIQIKLYKHYLGATGFSVDVGGKTLIGDYTNLRKIWTHPKIIEVAYNKALVTARMSEARRSKIINEDDEEVELIDRNDLSRFKDSNSVTSSWWKPLVKRSELESIVSSNKMILLFEILKRCKEKGEKCLIFSGFVTVLNCVEHFMKRIQEKHENKSAVGFENFEGPWVFGKDFYRIDGQTSRTDRYRMITNFNNKENKRTVCFLISAKAGGQGINLTGANRAIILDTSWNPATDQQCIFRIYRLGQEKTCYIYRLLSMGTMEEKIYSRSVTKQALSGRVVDKRVIDGKFTKVELHELYTLTLTDYDKRPTPIKPKDDILHSLLCDFPRIAYKYHEHDTLLEHNPNEVLTEVEMLQAWQIDLTKSGAGDLTEAVASTSFAVDAMVANIMSDNYENTIRTETLPNLVDQFLENKENIQFVNFPETITASNYENTLQNSTNHLLTENNVNLTSETLLATATEVSNYVSDSMLPIESEPVYNLITNCSEVDLTMDTQHDSDISIVNSPVNSKRQNPVIIDLTNDSQPDFDMSFDRPLICSPKFVSRKVEKRKQPSILQYVVKSQKFSSLIPVKREIKLTKKPKNSPIKVERLYASNNDEDVSDNLIELNTTTMHEGLDVNTAPAAEEFRASPMDEEEEEEQSDEEEERYEISEVATQLPTETAHTASISEMDSISKISFSEDLDIDMGMFTQNWNNETSTENYKEDEEENSYNLIPSNESDFEAVNIDDQEQNSHNLILPDQLEIEAPKSPMSNDDQEGNSHNLILPEKSKIDNSPMLTALESTPESDEIDEPDNLLYSQSSEMENLSMPYFWNTGYSDNFNRNNETSTENYKEDEEENSYNLIPPDESELEAVQSLLLMNKDDQERNSHNLMLADLSGIEATKPSMNNDDDDQERNSHNLILPELSEIEATKSPISNDDQEGNSHNLKLPEKSKIDNSPMLTSVLEFTPESDEIDEPDNLLYSQSLEMENLSMPYFWNTGYSDNFNNGYEFDEEQNSEKVQSKELSSYYESDDSL